MKHTQVAHEAGKVYWPDAFVHCVALHMEPSGHAHEDPPLIASAEFGLVAAAVGLLEGGAAFTHPRACT